jgi:hypothetical protein
MLYIQIFKFQIDLSRPVRYFLRAGAPGHVRTFQAVTTQLYGEVTLASCLIDGKPGVAIVLVDNVGEGRSLSCPCSSLSLPTWTSPS